MSLPVFGPIFFPGRGISVRRHPPNIQWGGTHPTGMLSCLISCYWLDCMYWATFENWVNFSKIWACFVFGQIFLNSG